MYRTLVMQYTPGDLLFIHGTGFFDRLIQFGQSRRFPKQDSYWNHVAIVISTEGDLIEALGKGVKQTHIQKYQTFTSINAKLIHSNLSDEDRVELVKFVQSCQSDGYGWLTILSTALCILFGLKFSFGFSGQDICSGLAAQALEHGGQTLPVEARHTTPADLMAFILSHPEIYTDYTASTLIPQPLSPSPYNSPPDTTAL